MNSTPSQQTVQANSNTNINTGDVNSNGSYTEYISNQSLATASDADPGFLQKIKKYGKVGILTHLAVSWTVLGIAYLVISRTNQTQKIIKFFKLENKVNKKAGNFAIAFLVYKASIPIRFGISLAVIPLVIKALDINVQQNNKINVINSLEAKQNQDNKQLLKSQAGIQNTTSDANINNSSKLIDFDKFSGVERK